ncbi:MAG: hypothetical protein ABFR35_10855 [Thermodesulfobacteriota bacterium]
MMKLKCQYVSATEAGDEIFQVSFEAVRDQEDGPYLLLQRAFLEEDDGDDAACYIETNEEHLIGHYAKIGAALTRNRLTINLPPPANETIEVNFQATDPEFQKIRRMLAIILQQDLK